MKQRMQSVEMLDNNVLINVQPNKSSTWSKEVVSD